MADESANATRRPEGEKVVEETINAYRVQRLANGHVRIKSGGSVVTEPTYYEALEWYAQRQQYEIEHASDHLQEEKRESITDGFIPLKSFDTSGFTPIEILDAVTIHPIDRIMEFLNE